MKRTKRRISVFLSVVMVLGVLLQLPVTAIATGSQYLSFTLNSAGTAYSVTGCSADATGEIIIPDTYEGLPVTSISDNAFKGVEGITKVVMADSITSVGDYAFMNCADLTELTLSAGLTTLGKSAFAGTAIESIHIPKTLDSASRSTSFTHTVNGVNYSVYPGPFYNCKNLKTVTFETGTTQIAENLFAGCMGIEKIEIPNTVTTIEDYAFQGCLNIKEAVIGDGVTSVGDYAFMNCTDLTALTLSAGLTTLGKSAFAGTAIESIHIPKTLDSASSGTFFTHTVNGVNYSIYPGPFYNCKNLKTVTFETGTAQIAENLFAGCMGIEKIEIPNTVTTIEDYAFQGCVSLKETVIGDGVTSIGSAAFENCLSLPKVVIPNSVMTIDAYAFRNCIALTDLTLSNRLTTLGERAFAGVAIESIHIPKTLDSVSSGTSFNHMVNGVNYGVCPGPFYNCKNLKTVTFETGTTQIAENLFAGCMGIEKIQIPNTVTTIEYYAFQGCFSLSEVILPTSITTIGERTFDSCINLNDVIIPDSVMAIGQGAFVDCDALTDIVLSNKLEKIEDYFFYDCDALVSVDLPSGVESIGSYSFFSCDSLKTITFPKSVKAIGYRTYENCPILETVCFEGGSLLKNVHAQAFKYCKSLKEIIFPEKTETVSASAFENCTSLEKVYFPQSLETIGSSAFLNCYALSDITFSDYSITEIPKAAFKNCSLLGTVELPKGLKTIAAEAFMNDTALVGVTIPESVTSINSTAFSYPHKTVIRGRGGSYAETFATAGGFAFENIAVPIEGIALKGGVESIDMELGEYYRADFDIFPEGANEVIVLSANNSNVFIDGHDLYAQRAGETVITATTTGGLTCTFNVHIRSVKNIRVTEAPAKTTYALGEMFNPTGMVVQAVYNDSYITDIDNYTLSGFDSSVEGECTVTVKWTAISGTSYSTTIKVNVIDTAPKLTGVYLKSLPNKLTYITRERLDTTGLILTATYNDGSEVEVSGYTLSGYNALKAGDQTITVTYEGFSDTFVVTVEKALEAEKIIISQMPHKTVYEVGELLDVTGLVIRLVYNNGTYEDLADGYVIDGFDSTTGGKKTVNVTYGDFTTSFDVTVKDPIVLASIEIAELPKTEYFIGEELDVTGLQLKLVYSDGSIKTTDTGYTTSGFESATAGTKVVTVAYSDFTVTFDVAVNEPAVLVDMEIVSLPAKTDYFVGETEDFSGLELKLIYSNATYEIIEKGYTVSGFDSSDPGEKTIVIGYQGFEKTFKIVVTEADINLPKIVVSSAGARRGNRIDVTIDLQDNPGLTSMTLKVNFDSSVLSLVSVTDGGVLGVQAHKPELTSPYTLSWVNDTATKNYTCNGTIVTLTFEVAEDAEVGKYPVTVSYDYDNYDIYDVDLNPVEFAVVNGSVEVIEYLCGDVNDDGKVNNLDRVLLTRYLADWDAYQDSVNIYAADVNNDGKVNNLDRVILTRYLADWEEYPELPYKA